MKQIYTLILSLAAMLIPGVLQAATVTINFDDPSRIDLEVNYEPYTGTLVAGDNVIEECFLVRVTAKPGYILESIDWKDGSYLLTIENNSCFFGVIGNNYYTVHTKVAEEANTGLVKLDVDKASAVTASFNETGRIAELNDGLNELSYDPELEKTLKIYSSATAQMPLYSVSIVDGTGNLSKTGNVYFLTLPCTGTVKVESQYPGEEHYVTFNLSTGAEGFIQKVTKDTPSGETLEINDNKVKVNSGTIIYIHGNVEDYEVTTFKVDDDNIDFENPHRVIVLQEDVTVSITATKYKEAQVTVTVNDPSMLKAYYGSLMYIGEEIPLTAGNNLVTINSNKNTMVFEPADPADFAISYVKVDGDELDFNYEGKVQTDDLYGGEKIEIEVAAIERTLEAVVYVDNAEGKNLILTSNIRKKFDLTSGYNHISFCAEDNPLTLKSSDMPYVYINDEDVTAFENTYRMSLSSGSVLKIYADTEDEPGFHMVTFAEKGFDQVDILADEIRPIIQRTGYVYSEGTKMEITPKDGVTAVVKVDGEKIEADENGKSTFKVTGAHNVEFEIEQSGIDGIINETVPAGVIYNLQGIRLNNADVRSLPAGIYIIDGKKTVVK